MTCTCGPMWKVAYPTTHSTMCDVWNERERESFSIAGTFRIHFNRHSAAPLVWSIALVNHAGGDHPAAHWEITVAELTVTTMMRTVYAPKATPDSEDGKPSAWLEVDGVLTVVGGEATITKAGA